MSNTKLVNKAPVVATIVATFLAIIKFIFWVLSWSVALLSSAMDSLLDMGVSIFNYFAIKFAQTPADEDHPYWHGKIEGIAATIEWTVITLSGLYIVYESVRKFFHPEPIHHLDWSIAVMIISIIATWGLVWFLTYVYNKTGNLVVKWDSLHYKMDLITNIAVFITLAIILLYPNLVWIDALVWFVIGIYIIHESFELIKEWIDLLLDRALEEHDDVEKILEKYVKEWKIKSYHCLKTRAGGNKDKFVEFHFVLDPQTTILKAHEIWDEIEEKIKNLDSDANWYVIWHSDPYDDSDTNWCK